MLIYCDGSYGQTSSFCGFGVRIENDGESHESFGRIESRKSELGLLNKIHEHIAFIKAVNVAHELGGVADDCTIHSDCESLIYGTQMTIKNGAYSSNHSSRLEVSLYQIDIYKYCSKVELNIAKGFISKSKFILVSSGLNCVNHSRADYLARFGRHQLPEKQFAPFDRWIKTFSAF